MSGDLRMFRKVVLAETYISACIASDVSFLTRSDGAIEEVPRSQLIGGQCLVRARAVFTSVLTNAYTHQHIPI
jgi:hypothetical protein